MSGTDVATYTRERPGMSAFVLEDGVVYHTYSTYARGLDGLWGMYQWLDRAPKGRNETDSGFAVTTSTTIAESSHGCRSDPFFWPYPITLVILFIIFFSDYDLFVFLKPSLDW